LVAQPKGGAERRARIDSAWSENGGFAGGGGAANAESDAPVKQSFTANRQAEPEKEIAGVYRESRRNECDAVEQDFDGAAQELYKLTPDEIASVEKG
jgi:hypothetical protein